MVVARVHTHRPPPRLPFAVINYQPFQSVSSLSPSKHHAATSSRLSTLLAGGRARRIVCNRGLYYTAVFNTDGLNQFLWNPLRITRRRSVHAQLGSGQLSVRTQRWKVFVSRKTSAQALRFFGSAWVDRTMYALQRSPRTDAQTVTDELEPCYGRPATSKPEVRVARRARSPRLVKQSTRSLGYVRCLVRSRRSCRGSSSRPVVAWARRQRIALSPGSS